MHKNTFFTTGFEKLLGQHSKESIEKIILILAVCSFIIHLALIFLAQFGILKFDVLKELSSNPIAAIYTPFSFILVYEVYLLVYYMPKSVTTYVSKQYEIITLIVIRRLFKDFSNLELTPDWLEVKGDLQFTYDIILTLLIFFMIFLFKRSISPVQAFDQETAQPNFRFSNFIKLKKGIAVTLVPVLAIIAVYSLINWLSGVFSPITSDETSFSNINHIFFEDFFTILIIVDVLLLLVSFFYTDSFHRVMRNSGFIISTILIRLSFSADGLLNNILIFSSILFGLLILVIHNKFEQLDVQNDQLQNTNS